MGRTIMASEKPSNLKITSLIFHSISTYLDRFIGAMCTLRLPGQCLTCPLGRHPSQALSAPS
jgi:hypothetical protein